MSIVFINQENQEKLNLSIKYQLRKINKFGQDICFYSRIYLYTPYIWQILAILR